MQNISITEQRKKIGFNKLENKLSMEAEKALKSLFSSRFNDKKSAQLFQCDLRGLIINDVIFFVNRIKLYNLFVNLPTLVWLQRHQDRQSQLQQ